MRHPERLEDVRHLRGGEPVITIAQPRELAEYEKLVACLLEALDRQPEPGVYSLPPVIRLTRLAASFLPWRVTLNSRPNCPFAFEVT